MGEVMVSREVRLRQRPEGLPTEADFEVVAVELREPGVGEARVRNTWMSVDPYMRGRMRDGESYLPPFTLGAAMTGGALGIVETSNCDEVKVGDTVISQMGWREGFVAKGETLRRLDIAQAPAEAYLGMLGLTGLTAYVGLLHIAKVKAGDVVFVSAAAGATGEAVCQMAKIAGATVIGSAGGEAKCAYLREIGVDRTIDYRAVGDLTAALKEAAPDGIDIYFESVGGAHLEAALAVAKLYARFAFCGMIAGYNDAVPGPTNMGMIIGKRLTLQGFLVSDHFELMPAFLQDMGGWIGAGRVRWRQTVEEGIERAPAAFLKLFNGESFGKMLVRL